MSREETNAKKPGSSMNWIAVLWYIHLHLFGIAALWLTITEAKWMTVLYAIFLTLIAYIGVTIGAHRYYAHKTFEATIPLRIFFIMAHTLAGVGSLYNWVLLHRMHHKYFGTDKDPYNYTKGFLHTHFFSNCKTGYLDNNDLVKSIDMRDIENDGYVWVQQRFYWVLYIFVTILFPINVPIAYWNESLVVSIFLAGILRLVIACNISWLVNSAILVWGLKPTDKFPVDDYSVFYVKKSYWQNYHYLYPRDWKSEEFGKYDTGLGTTLLKFWYELGLISMLTTMSSEDAREALYKIASKKISVQDAMTEVEKLSHAEAVRRKLQYWH
ncbi:hypothetical protein KPH14_008796 [Odynerus spinipes]|uniref:Uncharacterized protein n=1 Tax=Odynerus spinipes TaxID=1348599 RepID=A0AAD9VHR1_9HYME|nr:hypothetical protein KPH14_008796 [Odynerus spinipes]